MAGSECKRMRERERKMGQRRRGGGRSGECLRGRLLWLPRGAKEANEEAEEEREDGKEEEEDAEAADQETEEEEERVQAA